MKSELVKKAIATVLPVVLGFFGGVLAMFFPAEFHAFCGGVI